MPTKAHAVSAVVIENLAAVLRARGADPIQNVIGNSPAKAGEVTMPQGECEGLCRRNFGRFRRHLHRILDSGFAKRPECISQIAIEVIGVSN